MSEEKKYRHHPFTCPRCNYQTQKKSCMQKHFCRNKACPSHDEFTDIELTEEIKEKVLTNRRYFIPKPKENEKDKEEKHITNNFYNYNQYNAFVRSMDYPTKAEKYSIHMKNQGINIPILGYKEQIDKVLYDAGLDGEYLDSLTTNPNSCNLELTEHTYEDHTRTIGEITKCNPATNLTGIYHDGCKIFLNDEDLGWEEHYEKDGVKTLISYIKDQYWDKYELYLINRMNSHKNLLTRQKAKELLIEYYTFLRAFSLKPSQNEEEDTASCWAEAQKEKISVVKRIYKESIEMIKDNTASTFREINKLIRNNMNDPEFREFLLTV